MAKRTWVLVVAGLTALVAAGIVVAVLVTSTSPTHRRNSSPTSVPSHHPSVTAPRSAASPTGPVTDLRAGGGASVTAAGTSTSPPAILGFLTGGLALTVSDLPPGATPTIVVSGPDGYRTAPTASGTLSPLFPGSYVVSALPVSAGGATYYPTVTGSPATVLPGRVATVTVSYFDEVLDTTKVVPAGVAADLTGATGNTLTFTVGGAVPPALAGLQVGDVLVFGPSATTPNGLLVKVVSVTDGNGQVIVGTAPAGLADAIPRGSFTASETLTDSEIRTAAAGTQGVTVLTSTPSSASPPAMRPARLAAKSGHSQTATSATSTSGKAHPGSGAGPAGGPAWERNDLGLTLDTSQVSCGGGPDLSLSGTVHFSPSFNFNASWTLFTGLKASASGSLTEQTTLSVKAGGTVGCKVKFPLLDEPVDFDPIDIQIGPIPVVIEPDLQIYALVSAQGQVSATLGASYTQTSTLSAGVDVHNTSISPFSTYTQSVSSRQTPTVPEGGFSVQVAVGPELELLVYDVAGPTVNLDGFVSLDVTPADSPWWTLEAGVEAGAGFTLTIGCGYFASTRQGGVR